MKLTNRTIPQARNYQCDKCKYILCHKAMRDDNLCYDCYDKEEDRKWKEFVDGLKKEFIRTMNYPDRYIKKINELAGKELI